MNKNDFALLSTSTGFSNNVMCIQGVRSEEVDLEVEICLKLTQYEVTISICTVECGETQTSTFAVPGDALHILLLKNAE